MRLASLVAAFFLSTACAAGQAATAQTIRVTVEGGVVSPERHDVALGSRVRLEVTSDREDEVHIHGYDEKRAVGPGKPAVLEFVADQAGLFEVLLWVGVPLLSLLVGPVWRRLNPLRTIASLLRLNGFRPYPKRWGQWPGALLLVAFAWLELVAPSRTSLVVVGAFAALYVVFTLAGAAVYGPDWFEHADAFEVYSSLAAVLAPIGRTADGRRVLRNPLSGLADLPEVAGRSAVVLVLLGSTTYDGLSNAPGWITLVQNGPLPSLVTATLGLAAAILLVAGAYTLAVRLSGRIAGQRVTGTQFAHTVLPIALGYMVAHYFSLLLLHAFGLAVDPVLTSHLQVGAVLTGHVAGAIATHALARNVFRRNASASQVPMLALMLAFTATGLTLLSVA